MRSIFKLWTGLVTVWLVLSIISTILHRSRRKGVRSTKSALEKSKEAFKKSLLIKKREISSMKLTEDFDGSTVAPSSENEKIIDDDEVEYEGKNGEFERYIKRIRVGEKMKKLIYEYPKNQSDIDNVNDTMKQFDMENAVDDEEKSNVTDELNEIMVEDVINETLVEDVPSMKELKKSNKKLTLKEGKEFPQSDILAGLNCADHGGPFEIKAMEEMVYWNDIPTDANYKSQYYNPNKYLTFEPDHGGWNNIRMSMETILVLAHAMGRTLVLPPAQNVYLLTNSKGKYKFTFEDFFHLDSIGKEHPGLNVITMEEFLSKQNLGLHPPENKKSWDGEYLKPLWSWLQKVAMPLDWGPWNCLAAFGSKTNSTLNTVRKQLKASLKSYKSEKYIDNPVPVNATALDRLLENLDKRKDLCLYNSTLQQAPVIHIWQQEGKSTGGTRLLNPFYSFLYFEDYKVDLWYKRFIRDHVRYIDDIQCPAARIVQALRKAASKNGGLYDSIHVRRGDFQYTITRLPAEELLSTSTKYFQANSTLFIATDERDKTFFSPFLKHYQVYFLDDFKHLLEGVNPNYYGMIDQLVASTSENFIGTWWSTFSAYINRMRGYHSTKLKKSGFEKGTLQSWYFDPQGFDRKYEMRSYYPVRLPLYMREFPTSWRFIDFDVKK